MIRAPALLASALALLSGACAGLAPAPPPKPWTSFYDHPKGYLAAARVLPAVEFLPGPPAKGSPREAADEATYRATRKLEGSARWALAAADADLDKPVAPNALACALGADLDLGKSPRAVMLLARVMADVDASLKGAKARFQRPRPFVTAPAPICVAREDWLVKSGSYPSGHAATGWAWALVLGELAPDRATALAARGLAYGDSRVVCGVHYLSDVEAGRAVGAAVVARLHTDAGFRADLAAARREFDALRRTAPAPPPRCTAEAQTLEPRPF